MSYHDCWWVLVDLYLTEVHQLGKNPERYKDQLDDWVKANCVSWEGERGNLDHRFKLIQESDWAALHFIVAQNNVRQESFPDLPIEMKNLPIATEIPRLGRLLIWGGGVSDPKAVNWRPLSIDSDDNLVYSKDISSVDFASFSVFTLNPFRMEILKSELLARGSFSWEWGILSIWEEGKDVEGDLRLNESRSWAEHYIITLASFIGKAVFSRDQAQKLHPPLVNLLQYPLSQNEHKEDLDLLQKKDREAFTMLSEANKLIENLEGFLFTSEIARDNYHFFSPLFFPDASQGSTLDRSIQLYMDKILAELNYFVHLANLVRERFSHYMQSFRAEVQVLRGRIEEKRYIMERRISVIASAAATAIVIPTIVGLIFKPECVICRVVGSLLSIILAAIILLHGLAKEQ